MPPKKERKKGKVEKKAPTETKSVATCRFISTHPSQFSLNINYAWARGDNHKFYTVFR